MIGLPHGYLSITRARRRAPRWLVVLRSMFFGDGVSAKTLILGVPAAILAALALLVMFYVLPMFGGPK